MRYTPPPAVTGRGGSAAGAHEVVLPGSCHPGPAVPYTTPAPAARPGPSWSRPLRLTHGCLERPHEPLCFSIRLRMKRRRAHVMNAIGFAELREFSGRELRSVVGYQGLRQAFRHEDALQRVNGCCCCGGPHLHCKRKIGKCIHHQQPHGAPKRARKIRMHPLPRVLREGPGDEIFPGGRLFTWHDSHLRTRSWMSSDMPSQKQYFLANCFVLTRPSDPRAEAEGPVFLKDLGTTTRVASSDANSSTPAFRESLSFLAHHRALLRSNLAGQPCRMQSSTHLSSGSFAVSSATRVASTGKSWHRLQLLQI